MSDTDRSLRCTPQQAEVLSAALRYARAIRALNTTPTLVTQAERNNAIRALALASATMLDKEEHGE